MKHIYLGLILVLLMIVPGSFNKLHAQYDYKAPEIALSFTGTLVSGNAIKIGYSIPYPGFVEFHLFDPEGNKIWVTSYVREEKGEYYLAINRLKLEENATYSYDFFYKGKKYSGTFTNN